MTLASSQEQKNITKSGARTDAPLRLNLSNAYKLSADRAYHAGGSPRPGARPQGTTNNNQH